MANLKEIKALKEKGSWSEAQSNILKLVEENPNDFEAFLEAGLIHEKLEMIPQAITYYQKALELDADEMIRQHTLLQLGISYRAVGLYEQARETLEIGMSEFPSDHRFYVYFAMTLYNLGDADLAMEIILNKLLETTEDQQLLSHRELIEFYASCLDETFN
ncbi:tetratricopeptide repeat protein [Alkalibacillus aidingensis]|uniref:tetratricopeptide repeat protein n=1 Tax=Alkalibacillus aidingensis TaxID=2747607 RepID=UPI00166057B7|nr:tetratricopeptide repeat protein [Alkalibacillus aidingensis]